MDKMTLATKLSKIGNEIGKIDKSGKNTQQNYNYIEYGVVAGRIRELFDKYGVIIVPSVEDVETDEISNKYGSKGYHYVISMRFTLLNGDDRDDYIEATWRGESADYGDKGINKAETSGTKYFLMRLFNVSEKGEEEADSKSPEINRTSKMKARATEIDEYAIEEAKEKLKACKSLDELKSTFIKLGQIRNNEEIIELKDELKQTIIENDPMVKEAKAKEALDEVFGK